MRSLSFSLLHQLIVGLKASSWKTGCDTAPLKLLKTKKGNSNFTLIYCWQSWQREVGTEASRHRSGPHGHHRSPHSTPWSCFWTVTAGTSPLRQRKNMSTVHATSVCAWVANVPTAAPPVTYQLSNQGLMNRPSAEGKPVGQRKEGSWGSASTLEAAAKNCNFWINTTENREKDRKMGEIWFNTCFLSSTQTSLPAPKHSVIDLLLFVCACY